MKRYHILFFETKDSRVSTGKNYTANKMSNAVYEFEMEHPYAVILNVSGDDILNFKY